MPPPAPSSRSLALGLLSGALWLLSASLLVAGLVVEAWALPVMGWALAVVLSLGPRAYGEPAPTPVVEWLDDEDTVSLRERDDQLSAEMEALLEGIRSAGP